MHAGLESESEARSLPPCRDRQGWIAQHLPVGEPGLRRSGRCCPSSCSRAPPGANRRTSHQCTRLMLMEQMGKSLHPLFLSSVSGTLWGNRCAPLSQHPGCFRGARSSTVQCTIQVHLRVHSQPQKARRGDALVQDSEMT